MSVTWQRIRDRLDDLGWDVSVLDAAEKEVWQAGHDAAVSGECGCEPEPPPRRRRRKKADPEGMCPNCVTPWKCNGPHEP